MSNIKIVHTADIHIKKKGDESFIALKEILENTKKANAHYLFITGDLFENDKAGFDSRTDLRELFESYSDITILMTSGNHDEQSYAKNIDYGSNVTILNEKPFEKVTLKEGLTVYGVPFERGSNFSTFLGDIKIDSKNDESFKIIATHGTLVDDWLKYILIHLADHEKDKDSFYIHGDDFKNSNLNLVLLGHYHSFTEKDYDGTLVSYCGSPIATSIKNSGKRRASLIDINPKDKSSRISPITLENSYYVSKTFQVAPNKEEKVLEVIADFIESSKDKMANIEISLRGFTSLNEKELSLRLKEIEKKHKKNLESINIKNKTRMISALQENPVSAEFLSLWEKGFEENAKSEESIELYYKALELSLSAFEETVLKKK